MTTINVYRSLTPEPRTLDEIHQSTGAKKWVLKEILERLYEQGKVRKDSREASDPMYSVQP